MTDPKLNDELQWLAFRYLADEMGADERVAWELRLADDQAAREAVAEAMELTLAVQHAERMMAEAPAQRRSSPWWQRAGWVAAGVAASALVMIWSAGQGNPNPEGLRPSADRMTRELAIRWSETRERIPVEPLLAGELLGMSAGEIETYEPLDADTTAAQSGWIAAAVLGMQAESEESAPANSAVDQGGSS